MSRTLSHYEILEEIGRGGMGVVYRARDTRLDRIVAIKLLSSPSLISEHERLRFFREARAAAALNHPNIATVYEIDEASPSATGPGSAAQPFIAMEFIDGEPLSDRIARGLLSIEDVARIGGQIAEALDEAHRHGIVHRDIKGANVLVTQDGKVKILDFGIARAASATTITEEGTTVGTISYMSPEQARGEPVDGRSDIWSLGVLLYEMIVGQPPFRGAYDQAIVFSILNEDPEPVTALRSGVPMKLEIVVEKTLEKKPSDRYQHADEVRVDLDRIAKGKTHTSVRAQAASRAQAANRHVLWRSVPWVIALAATVAVMVLLTPDGAPVVERAKRLTIPTDTLVLGDHPATSVVAITPDGSQIVYVGVRRGQQHLFLRGVESYEAVEIPGTEGGSGPFFSPDGQWLGYVADNVLYKLPIGGGGRIALCGAPVFHGASWTESGEILISMDSAGGDIAIFSLSDTGGVPVQITEVDRSVELFHVYPVALPDETEFLYVSLDASGKDPKIWVHERASGIRHLLVQGGNPQYIKSGHIVYPLAGSLWAARLDLDPVEMQAAPAVVADGVLMGFLLEPSIAHFSVSNNGTLVYLPGHVYTGQGNEVLRTTAAGEEDVLLRVPRAPGGVRLSPDGSRLAIRMPDNTGVMQVWVYDLGRDVLSQLTTRGQNWWPVWTSDGTRILFPEITSRNDTDVAWLPADGGQASRTLIGEPGLMEIPYSVSGDGRTVFYQREEGDPTGWDLWAVELNDTATARQILGGEADEFHPAISPDGKWLAFTAGPREAAAREVFVTDYPATTRRWQVSSGGGLAPVWSRDGKQLFFQSGPELTDGPIVSVEWVTEPSVQPGRPEPVFTGGHEPSMRYGRNYDVAADGSFLIIRNERPSPQTRLNIVVDWFDELHRLVP